MPQKPGQGKTCLTDKKRSIKRIWHMEQIFNDKNVEYEVGLNIDSAHSHQLGGQIWMHGCQNIDPQLTEEGSRR